MKLRAILSVLAALALFSALLGAGVYYVSVQETQAQSARRRVESRAESVRLRIDSVIAGHLDAAEALAGLPAIRRALASGDASALAEANAVLDTFAAALREDDAMQARVERIMADTLTHPAIADFAEQGWREAKDSLVADVARGDDSKAAGALAGGLVSLGKAILNEAESRAAFNARLTPLLVHLA
ncbi:MAG: DUF445 family protein, partial [Thermodesulfobacteriota bacterium]